MPSAWDHLIYTYTRYLPEKGSYFLTCDDIAMAHHVALLSVQHSFVIRGVYFFLYFEFNAVWWQLVGWQTK
jgi:hypothetical protein